MCLDSESKVSVFVREVYDGAYGHIGSCIYCSRPSNLYRYGWSGSKLSDPVCSLHCYVRVSDREEVRR